MRRAHIYISFTITALVRPKVRETPIACEETRKNSRPKDTNRAIRKGIGVSKPTGGDAFWGMIYRPTILTRIIGAS